MATPTLRDRPEKPEAPRVRYAVIGLGHIAQVAVLPAFAHAKRNSRLTALISGDATKLAKLGDKYRVEHRLGYDEIDRLADDDLVDAAYIALPNDRHFDVALRLAEAGLHVLCEKPLAMTERQCRTMVEVAQARGVHLMTAYRLHFDQATLAALETVRSGRIGEPRFITSSFSMQVTDPDNIRLSAARGGGPLYDLGVYCINAARMLFEAEPIDVFGATIAGHDPRFDEVPEMVTAVLRFPEDRLASFTCSFGAADTSSYRIVGTQGDLVVDPAYDYSVGLAHTLTVDGRVSRRKYAKKDQFGPELLAFSAAILEGGDEYPSGIEGWADVRVMEAVMASAREGAVLRLPPQEIERRPTAGQGRSLPPVRKPEEVHARSPGD
jgi:predicted dehydrogenase